MSVGTELQRLIDAKAAIRAAIIAQGVTVDAGLTLDAYAARIALIAGGDPVPTEPAAFVTGNWTLTPIAGGLRYGITALPANGGSAITDIQETRDAGTTWTSLGGATTGDYDVTGLPETLQTTQIRAVNAVAPGDPSDVKTATPAAAPAPGALAWESVATSTGDLASGGAGTTPTRPASVASTDLLTLTITNLSPAQVTDMAVPAGWTLAGSMHTDFAGETGFAVYTASGSVADAAWKFATISTPHGGYFDMHRISGANLTTPVRSYTSRVAHVAFAAELDDMPSPSATAVAGDLVLALYHQPQSGAAVGTPTAGYTRVVDTDVPNRRSAVVRSDLAAGATGDISHNASAAYQSRGAATIVIAPA